MIDRSLSSRVQLQVMLYLLIQGCYLRPTRIISYVHSLSPTNQIKDRWKTTKIQVRTHMSLVLEAKQGLQ